MLSKNVLYDGRQEPVPERIALRAGPLSLIYVAGDLRTITLGDREILRRVYVALRDHNWGTAPAMLSNVQMDIRSDSFRITYDAENKQGSIDFAWKAVILGEADGTITFSLDGAARSTFLRNRIGLCVLHPIRECAGQACVIEKTTGIREQSAFPYHISPHQPFLDVRAITHEIAPGVQAEVRFEGDVFETEDQRNWTDTSYKTYSTPLSLPLPVEIPAGTCVKQSVALRLKGYGSAPIAQDARLTLSVGTLPAGPLPRLGLGIASHGQPLSTVEVARLKALNLAHLRLDLTLSRPDAAATLRKVTAEANAVGAPLQIALFLSDTADADLEKLVGLLQEIRPSVCAWLVFHVAEKSTAERWVTLARQYLAGYDPAAKIGAGSNANFTEVNRGRPPVKALDLVSYSLNPQVHAFDNASLVENLAGQGWTVKSARQFSGDLPIVVTPVTLKPRFNPNAAGTLAERVPGSLPPQVDARQMSLLGAGWTLGSLKHLAESGAYSVTYFETTGWRGVMETEDGSPEPEWFRSLPGSVFPLYHVLADVGEWAVSEVVPVASSDGLKAEGLALRKHGKLRILVANLSREPQRMTVQHLPLHVRVRCLDEANAEEAMRSPENWRAQAGRLMPTSAGAFELHLLPYAIARIDGV